MHKQTGGSVRKEIIMKRFAVFAIAVVMSVLFAACNNADDFFCSEKIFLDRIFVI